MRGVESFTSQVCDPVIELVVTLRDKADPLTVKGMVDRKGGVAAVGVMREVWEL